MKPVKRLRENDFREDLDDNLLGAVKAIQDCLPRLQRVESASITLFSTVAVQTDAVEAMTPIHTLRDVAGVEEAKEDVAELVDFLRNPQQFGRLGGPVPRGLTP